MQIERWKSYLQGNNYKDDELVHLVKQYPIHIREIDFLVQQANISKMILYGKDTQLNMNQIYEAIVRFRGEKGIPILFGERN